MKATKLTGIILLFTMSFSLNGIAQEAATKNEYKAIQKHEKELKKEIKKDAVKEARKEAKKLQKDGFKVPAGKLPLDKQLEESWMRQYEVDADGHPIYYIATQRSVGGSYSAAVMQATNLAKLDLAGQLQTKVTQLIETQVSNSELGKEEAATVINVVSSSKSMISATLGRTLPLVEIYKTLPNNNVEVMVTIGYSNKMALKAALQAVRDDLAKKSEDLAKKIDKLAE